MKRYIRPTLIEFSVDTIATLATSGGSIFDEKINAGGALAPEQRQSDWDNYEHSTPSGSKW